MQQPFEIVLELATYAGDQLKIEETISNRGPVVKPSAKQYTEHSFRDVNFRSNIPFPGAKYRKKVQIHVTEGTFCVVFRSMQVGTTQVGNCAGADVLASVFVHLLSEHRIALDLSARLSMLPPPSRNRLR